MVGLSLAVTPAEIKVPLLDKSFKPDPDGKSLSASLPVLIRSLITTALSFPFTYPYTGSGPYCICRPPAVISARPFSLSRSSEMVFSSHVCICWTHMCPFVSLHCVSVSISHCLSCPSQHRRIYLETEKETLAPPSFTYGNCPLSTARFPTIPYLVSHGLLCTSVQIQDPERPVGVRGQRREQCQSWL